MKSSKKILLASLLLFIIIATLSSCEIGGFEVTIPGWEAFNEKFGPHEHDMKPVAEVPATCYAEGAKAHYFCEKCNLIFADEMGTLPLDAPESIPTVAHTEEVVKGKAPTCTDDGLTDGTKCSVCSATVKEQQIIPATKHTEVIVEAIHATCTTSGLTEGKICSVCGVTTVSQHLEPALGHSFDNDQDDSCNNCDYVRCLHTNTEALGEAIDATCEREGLTEGVICSDCGHILENQKAVEKVDHTPITDEAVAPECLIPGLTEGEHCSVCGITIKAQETVPPTGHIFDNDADMECNVCGEPRCFHEHTEALGEAIDATCDTEGLTEGVKCSNCGFVLEAQKSIEALGHKPSEAVEENVIDSTCSAEGSYDLVVYCSACGDKLSSETKIIEKTPHTEVIDPAENNGCLRDGITEGKHCSGCGEILTAQETTKAIGKHSWNGTVCTVCGAVKFEAEASEIETDINRLGAGMQSGKTPESTNYPSGDGYVYYLSDAGNATLTFYITADKTSNATISFCFGLSNGYTADQLFSVTVNGTEVEYYASASIPKYSDAGVIQYFGWYEVEVADIELQEGENTVVLTKTDKGLNFDYIAIRSTDGAKVENTLEKNGHNYENWSVITAPTYEAKGEIGAYCAYCRDYSVVELPAVSTENGYTKISSGVKAVWEYTYDGENFRIELEDTDLDAKVYNFAVVDTQNPFTNVVDNNGETNNVTGINTNKYGTFYQYTKGASFTITVNVEEATEVSFIVRICSTNNYSFDYAQAITSVTSASASGKANKVTVNSGTVNTVGWYTDTASAIEIATISLEKGINTITFTMGTETAKDLNVASVEFVSFIPVELVTSSAD